MSRDIIFQLSDVVFYYHLPIQGQLFNDLHAKKINPLETLVT